MSYVAKPNHGLFVPGADDHMYNAVIQAFWAYFRAKAILARLAIHQSKGSPAMAATALAEVARAFPAEKYNAQFIFYL